METRPPKESSSPPEASNTEVFVAWVEDQIKSMKRNLSLGSDEREMTFFELNQALRTWTEVQWSLTSLYSIANMELKQEEESFENWYANVFIDIRARENKKDLSAQKWASQKELELIIRKEHSQEFSSRRQKVLLKEREVAFLRRIIESWTSHQFILTQLSKNVIAEVGGVKMGE